MRFKLVEMETIIWINFFVNILIIGYVAYRENRIYISVNKTFWCKKTYSITVMWNSKPLRKGVSATGLFTIPIRNYEKMEQWDDEMFKSGEYKTYCA